MHKLAIARVVTGLLTVGLVFCQVAHGDQNQALTDAAMIGDLKQVQTLLDEGADVNAKDKHGVTALWLASKMNHPHVVRLLLEKGADVNVKGNDGVTALIEAASFTPSGGKREVMRLLLDRGANVNAKDYRGATALMHASAEDHLDVVQLLLHKGADVDAKDKEGKTALIWATKYGKLDHVGPLLDKGADPNAKDEEGKTALMWASGWGGLEAARMLLDKVADINAKDKEGETALMVASKYDCADVVELLKARGAEAQANEGDLFPGKKRPAGPYVIGDKARGGSAYQLPELATDEPINISSTKFSAKSLPYGKEATFEGNVKLTQRDVILICDQLVIVYSEKAGFRTAEERDKKLRKGLENFSHLKRIIASGNVKIVQNERMTMGRKIIYDHVKGTITIVE